MKNLSNKGFLPILIAVAVVVAFIVAAVVVKSRTITKETAQAPQIQNDTDLTKTSTSLDQVDTSQLDSQLNQLDSAVNF